MYNCMSSSAHCPTNTQVALITRECIHDRGIAIIVGGLKKPCSNEEYGKKGFDCMQSHMLAVIKRRLEYYRTLFSLLVSAKSNCRQKALEPLRDKGRVVNGCWWLLISGGGVQKKA